jgi:hypothetical protein
MSNAITQIAADYVAERERIRTHVAKRFANQDRAKRAAFRRAKAALEALGLSESEARRALWRAIPAPLTGKEG